MLRDCGALAKLFPEIDRLYGVPQSPKWHPEIDTGVHTMMVLDQGARLTTDLATRFAALTHDLGKGTTPKDEWPSHKGHEVRSVELVEALCARLRAPKDVRELAVISAEFHGLVHKADELDAEQLIDLLERADAFRRPERFEKFLMACEADHRGRTGYEDTPYPQGAFVRRVFGVARELDIRPIIGSGVKGEALGQAIHDARVRALAPLKYEEL